MLYKHTQGKQRRKISALGFWALASKAIFIIPTAQLCDTFNLLAFRDHKTHEQIPPQQKIEAAPQLSDTSQEWSQGKKMNMDTKEHKKSGTTSLPAGIWRASCWDKHVMYVYSPWNLCFIHSFPAAGFKMHLLLHYSVPLYSIIPFLPKSCPVSGLLQL